MNLYNENKYANILATESRKADISPQRLSEIHREIGKFLGMQMLEEFTLKTLEINHVQGKKKGYELDYEKGIVLVILMRAGLYVAEGLRRIFTNAEVIFYNQKEDINEEVIEGKTVIIVDSVINTGKSIKELLNELKGWSMKDIYVTCSVIQKDALKIFEENKNGKLYALRYSENKYTGKGSTDTGNRLFGTLDR